MASSSILDVHYEVTDDGLQYQTRHSNLSRLSVCTSSLHDEEDDVANNASEVGIFMSGLSLESFDGADADEEVSDVDKGRGKEQGGSSDSDKEPGFYSLPSRSSRRRRKLPVADGSVEKMSENERKKDERKKGNIRRQRRERRPPWMVKERADENMNSEVGVGGSFTVITRARGGKKSMRMGLEEVKACKDLGFELDHECTAVEVVPGRVSVSGGSTFDTQTSSGGNSPVASWRISGPGEDPREVKARLKMWAQAVAFASASRYAS
ncbi:PREDICTED: uncharacterized protein LOC104827649 [Tarenaya hassleriana]|uniref:uncharacterized protein LOC104827649 n=1 Tax=Tarenaya hassleriana TaxID=28532 RepID=UPI00053C17DF|nr:PREDICTED: uncharacterized protein LOC104827649 [Tarenaya hassleriana]